ncbi:hypothetical protein H2199_003268 [Coniosporium tulheliwenetii]|uniref:Uncharacterized protein n=1 Tax=Coniosporium tulheliwenetii TaxID=3383036 RepID=A0ACC2ZBU3_9PEZI|nr:hypothetical protein H2199_003268 [Cladosporium sp. JES 115]
MQQAYGNTGQGPYQQAGGPPNFGQQPPQIYGSAQGYPPAPAPYIPTSSPHMNQTQWAANNQAMPQQWGQQAPGLSYGAPAQNAGYQQPGQQGAYFQQPNTQTSPPAIHQQQSYNPAAPPPPSATPGGSYFPPAPGRANSASFPPTTGDMNTTSPPPVWSPNEQQPAYVPPSLSGQGVAAYIPSNTNPLPGVYVPPPPDIPAWTHAQTAGFSGQNKKFRYMKPIVHPSYQAAAQGYGGMAAGMPQAPQAPPPMPQNYNAPAQRQMPPPPQPYNMPAVHQMPPAQQQQQQPFQQYPQQPLPPQPLPQQPMPHQFQQSPAPPQPSQSPQTQLQYPPPNAPQAFGSPGMAQRPPQASFQSQPYSTSQTPGQNSWQDQVQSDFARRSSYGNQHAQSQQQSFHGPSPVHTAPQVPQRFEEAAGEQDPHFQPVSPLQQRASISLSQATEQRERQSSIDVPRKPVRSSTVSSTATFEAPSSSSASALGRGGPSDWEHFASGEELNEPAARSSVSAARPVSPQQLDSYELPSQPSPPPPMRKQREPSVTNLPEESWPISPEPAPLNVSRPPSAFQQSASAPPLHDKSHQYSPSIVSIETPDTKSIRVQSPQPPLTTTKSPSPISSVVPQAMVVAEPQRLQQSPQPADLIPDLDPWYTGSLERYIAMLRLEANTASVEDKIQVFTLFLKAESQVRGIDLAAMFQPMPAPMTATEVPLPQPVPGSELPSMLNTTQDLPHRPALTSPVPSSDYVVVEQMAQEEYSPGGRPTISSRLTKGQAAQPMIDRQSPQPERSMPIIEGKPLGSSERQHDQSTPTEVAPTSSPYKAFRSSAAPSVSEPAAQSVILTPTTSASGEDFSRDGPEHEHSTAQPAYKPYTGGSSEDIPRFNIEPSAVRPSPSHHASSSAPRRKHEEIFFEEPPASNSFFGGPAPEQTSMPEQTSDSVTPYPPSPSAPQRGLQDAFPTSDPIISSPLGVQTGQDPFSAVRVSSPEHAPMTAPSPHESIPQILLEFLPPTIAQNPPPHPCLNAITASASQLSSDYTYIASLTSTWEAGAAQLRSRLASERRQRQEETEARNEELYNDNEIDYAEMNQLDEDFRIQEAAKEASEAKAEYQSYVDGVFGVVFGRLQHELGTLMSLFAEVEAMLAERAVSGIAALSPAEEGKDAPPTIVHALEVLLMLHQKIEERHAKIVAAVADRDRRYKRTEIAPLYAAKKVALMKQAERHFEQAEKQAVIKAAGEREARDDGERILELVQQIDAQDGSQDGAEWKETVEKTVEKAVEKARLVRRALAELSKALMRHFHTVEVEMNDVEYASEVAKAKADGADKDAFGRLEAQKAAEDKKLEEEFQSRIKMIDEDLRDAEKVISEVEGMKGNHRMVKALEDAKRRNREIA